MRIVEKNTLLGLCMHDTASSYFASCSMLRTRMMTSSNWSIFGVTGHLCGECTGLWWIPRGTLMYFFYLRLNKRLSKQSLGWWFETLSHPLWRHCNGLGVIHTTSDMSLVHPKLQKSIQLKFDYWRTPKYTSVDAYQVNNSTWNAPNPKINNFIHKDCRRA